MIPSLYDIEVLVNARVHLPSTVGADRTQALGSRAATGYVAVGCRSGSALRLSSDARTSRYADGRRASPSVYHYPSPINIHTGRAPGGFG